MTVMCTPMGAESTDMIGLLLIWNSKLTLSHWTNKPIKSLDASESVSSSINDNDIHIPKDEYKMCQMYINCPDALKMTLV